MSFDSVKNTVAHNLDPAEFGRSFYDSAVEQPLNALRQITGARIQTDAHKNDTLAAQAGNLAGFILDFTLLSKLTSGAMRPLLGAAADSILGHTATMAVSGGLYGGVLTPSSPDKGLLAGRLENAAVSGSTFAIMGGLGKALDGANLVGGSKLGNRMLGNALSGGAGGVVNAYGSIYFNDHRIASPGEVLANAGQYAAFGAGFGAFDYGLSKGAERLMKVPQVESAYYRARWKMQDARVEAKRLTYSVLNKYEMRHPLQRLGDVIYGTNVGELAKAPLTNENNPVSALQRELPEYFKQIDARQAVIDQTNDRRASYDLHEQMKDYRVGFAHRLLTLWHGTSEQPGISQYTNDELAKAGVTVEQAAAARNALSSTAKEKWPSSSPLTTALAELAGISDPLRAHDSYSLLGEIGYAKERFFGYNEDELSRRMAMPTELHYKDHAYGTPLDWMPFEPTDKLPNLFHGTVSKSLPSIFEERAMLPARELRLRGIGQVTGESATEEFPRRAISLTRDFNEAWAYNRHSPEFLTTYPVVMGVSRDVMSHSSTAGMLEPGELLTDKLRVGNSLLTRLGLRKPEVTHIYVPDRQVPALNQLMQRYRITGVQAVGLSEIPQPQWIEEPEIARRLAEAW